MSKFSKKDFYFSVVTGLITGFSAWRIFEYLEIPVLHFGRVARCINNINDIVAGGGTGCYYDYSVAWMWLLIIMPVLWILGVLLGYFLGKWMAFFNQFGKFAAIGFTNAAVDFGVLNLLISNTGVSGGGWYPVFKGISFLCAIIPSYFWNKHWAFQGTEGTSFEFAKFISVAVISIFINTGTASLIVNYVDPIGGLNLAVWANVGAVAGSAVALVFSFVGFKVAVFKK